MCQQDATILRFAALCALAGSRGEATRRVQAGTWEKIRRGTYAAAGSCTPARTAAEHGGALGCISAARHLGIWVLPSEDEVHVWMPRGGRSHSHKCRCIVHFDKFDADAFGLPTVPQILRQILRCRGIEWFFASLESAMRQKLIDDDGLRWLRDHTNHAARDAIDFATADADSGIESLFRWRMRGLGLAVRSQQKIANVGIVDFLIGDRLIVEIDGKENHEGAPLRHKDLVRDAAAASADFTTLRFDFAQVVHDWPTVERAVLAQVAAFRHLR